MITLQCKLTFENEKEKQELLDLMRQFTSCYRYSYNRLIDGQKRKKLKKHLLKQKIKQLNKDIKLLRSLNSEPQAQELVNQRKEQVRGWQYVSYKLWQVFKVALTIPVLGKSLPRELSPLKPILMKGIGIGSEATGEIPPAGECLLLLRRNTNTPAQSVKVSFLHFGLSGFYLV